MSERIREQLRGGENEVVTIKTALTRGVHELLPENEGLARQMEHGQIKLYLGIDPTSPDLHIGHTVPLRKLRQFQDLGHDVTLLFGTFTGMIGDPTDKSASRVRLTPEQIERNITTYTQQAGRILDLSSSAVNPVTIAHNHEWLGDMKFAEVVELMANFSVQQMMERKMFQARVEAGKPVWLHELAYPLMQGFDAVALGVDLEIGGKDQTFNMLVGRELVKRYQDRKKWVMALKLIEDPGGKKMGKTEGNIVNIEDWPEWKYEAVMSWPDSAIFLGFELLTSIPMSKIREAERMLREGEIHPMDLKKTLAYRVVAETDGVQGAEYAEEEFDLVKRKRQLPRRLREVEVISEQDILKVLVKTGLVKTIDEASAKMSQGAVYVDGNRSRRSTTFTDGSIIQIGKRTIKNIRGIKIVN